MSEPLSKHLSEHRGGCHCGNLRVSLRLSQPPAETRLRACGCSFCRAHNTRTTSDPNGSMQIDVRERDRLVRYRFGLRTADFLLCAHCGVYIGALLPDDSGGWFTVNVNTFREPPPLDCPIQPIVYESEDIGGRIDRRRTKWTPVKSFHI